MGYPEKRREVLEQTMRDEVFRVAVTVLSQEGFEALTVERIAREVGVSRGTLYNYFSDATAVIAFVEGRLFEPVRDQVEGIAVSDRGPEAKLTLILHCLLDALYESRALALAIFARRELQGLRAEQHIQMRNHLLAAFRGVLQEGAARGVFRHAPAEPAAELLVSAIAGIATSMLYAGDFRPADQMVPGLMDVLLYGLTPKGGVDWAVREWPGCNP
jgi:AcrR family transcriptional regulator